MECKQQSAKNRLIVIQKEKRQPFFRVTKQPIFSKQEFSHVRNWNQISRVLDLDKSWVIVNTDIQERYIWEKFWEAEKKWRRKSRPYCLLMVPCGPCYYYIRRIWLQDQIEVPIKVTKYHRLPFKANLYYIWSDIKINWCNGRVT